MFVLLNCLNAFLHLLPGDFGVHDRHFKIQHLDIRRLLDRRDLTDVVRQPGHAFFFRHSTTAFPFFFGKNKEIIRCCQINKEKSAVPNADLYFGAEEQNLHRSRNKFRPQLKFFSSADEIYFIHRRNLFHPQCGFRTKQGLHSRLSSVSLPKIFSFFLQKKVYSVSLHRPSEGSAPHRRMAGHSERMEKRHCFYLLLGRKPPI